MNSYPFDRKKEAETVGEFRPLPFEKKAVAIHNTPVSIRENFARLIDKGDNLWFATNEDFMGLWPKVVPDSVARGSVMDVYPNDVKGGKDMFGVDWVFVPAVGGSMVKPGNPVLRDIEDWKKVIKFPDVSKWAWEKWSEDIAPYTDERRLCQCTVPTGLFERLISFMDFEGAAMALIDEEQQEYVHELFSALCDMYDDIIDRLHRYGKCDILEFHDDWGSQRAPFFSLSVCREMLVPYMKRIAESCHKRGMYLHLHSCGKNELLVPAMIEAGVDMWIPQPMNDVDALAEKYGDRLVFGYNPPVLAPDASDDEIKRAAEDFVNSRKSTRVFVFKSPSRHRGVPVYEKFFDELYMASREMIYSRNK